MQVTVDMPPASANSQPGRLMGKGVTVRVEYELGQPIGFAARVRFHPRLVYPPLPLGNGVPWRNEEAVSPSSRQQARMRRLVLERPENPFL